MNPFLFTFPNKYIKKEKTILNYIISIDRARKLFIAYHGDTDGITAAVLLIHTLKQLGFSNLKYKSYPQFRDSTYSDIMNNCTSQDFIIFVEGHGFTDNYRSLENFALTIDHHPLQNKISTFLNPVEFSIDPNPACVFVMYNLLNVYIPDSMKWIVQFGSYMDYCPIPLNIETPPDLKSFEILKSYFYAIQYSNPETEMMVELLLKNIPITTIIDDYFFSHRKAEYENLISLSVNSILKSHHDKFIIHNIVKSSYRLASPLANIISQRYPNKIIIITELDPESNRYRVSVRNKNGIFNIGNILQSICKSYREADGVGHSKAASFRCNVQDLQNIIRDFKNVISS